MPRKDKTFSSNDVIRIYSYNLTDDEIYKVRLFFQIELDREQFIEEELWPLEICEDLSAVFELIEVFLDIVVEISEIAQGAKHVLEQIYKLAEKYNWIPFFSTALLEEIEYLIDLINKLDPSKMLLLHDLADYFFQVRGYVMWKCYKK